MLFTESRRSKRYIALLPVSVNAVDMKGKHVAGPWSGRIIDLSRHGASLFLTRVMDGPYHICFSVQENKEHLLRIVVSQSTPGTTDTNPVSSPKPVVTEDGKEIVLMARPVWMNSYDHEDLVAFRMGVEFIDQPSRKEMSVLKKAMKNQMNYFEQEHSS